MPKVYKKSLQNLNCLNINSTGQNEKRKGGRMGKDGRMEYWNDGKMEECKNGRMQGELAAGRVLVDIFQDYTQRFGKAKDFGVSEGL